MDSVSIITGLDIIDTVDYLVKKNKKYQAILLQNLEEIRDNGISEFLKNNKNITDETKEYYKTQRETEFQLQRKLVLDWSNNYTRSILRTLLGNDFEGKLR